MTRKKLNGGISSLAPRWAWRKKAIHLNPRSNKQYDRNKKMLSSSNGISYSISTLKSVKTLKCHQAFWVPINDKILRSVLLLTPAQQTPYWSVLEVWKIKFNGLDFLSILNWIFTSYTGSKNPVRNRQKIKFVELDFSN